ncbi:unnamed protein product [Protopolystoma xenopodis]|uniref:Calponin-homology (CH) domain-containing protein n=1 Tax=Protopolystoma xenopodis TaxID=117903 RepID=A0A448WT42_9PLAT|nr:unnamed protein product [Protopolystoma xenopodis]
MREYGNTSDSQILDAGYVDADEEMPEAERDLAEDAQWKIIQKNTFTRWTNEHLKKVNMVVEDLESDFSDGLRLVGLVETLSGHKFKYVNKKPNFRTQKLENVTLVMRYLEEHEGLRLISIGLLWIKENISLLTFRQ